MFLRWSCASITAMCLSCAVQSFAQDKQNRTKKSPIVESIVVIGRSERLVGSAPSASTGRVGQAEIERVPFLRPGEVLERVPGLIATQHSGSGKANQFFLRGFNLDHGTDFSVFLEGVPLNLPTHAHGQGYLDVNLLIPELIEVVEFRKGPYFTDVGDFSSAGTSSIDYANRLDQPFVQASAGAYDYYRMVAAGSDSIAGGDLLLGGEFQSYDGPWNLDQELSKYNGIGKWTWEDDEHGFSLFVSGYAAKWNSTDQIPRRAVVEGLISRFGNLDDDLGGETSRYTGTASYWNGTENSTRVRAYVSFYELDLWSNFTYFLNDSANGDEFQQSDQRAILGLDASQELSHTLGSRELRHTFGLQLRHDIVTDLGLFHTAERKKLSTVRDDRADVTGLGLYWQSGASINDWLRAYVGLRGDLYWSEIDDNSPPDTGGNGSDGIVSPKIGVVLGPWASTEVYFNYGRGFHSNDARGTTGPPADRVDFLVQSDGAEIGARSTALPGLQSTLSLWWLDLDSELLFVGDAGTTEGSRPSRRYGVELANYYQPWDWLTLDLDLTFTDSEFRGSDPAGNAIPGAVQVTVAGGAAVDLENGIFGSLRLRHFGQRPLIEDSSVKSDPTTLVNLRAGWHWRDFPGPGEPTFGLDVLNLLDAKDDDITYFYRSRLPSEGADGFDDTHFHPVEPRMIRASVSWRF